MGRKNKALGNLQFCRDIAGILHRIMKGRTLKTKKGSGQSRSLSCNVEDEALI
jgi:hypothetical protein